MCGLEYLGHVTSGANFQNLRYKTLLWQLITESGFIFIMIKPAKVNVYNRPHIGAF